jgi:hypothetical protein
VVHVEAVQGVLRHLRISGILWILNNSNAAASLYGNQAGRAVIEQALGRAPEAKERIRRLADSRYSFITQVLGRELGIRR